MRHCVYFIAGSEEGVSDNDLPYGFSWCFEPTGADSAFGWFSPAHASDAFEFALDLGICAGRGIPAYVYCPLEQLNDLVRDSYDTPPGMRFLSSESKQDALKDYLDRLPFDQEMRERVKCALVKAPERASGQRGLVYLLKAGVHYKIGKASQLDRRVRQLAIQLPFRADVVHSIPADDATAAERFFHVVFAQERTNGEWFDLSEKQVQWLKRIRTWPSVSYDLG